MHTAVEMHNYRCGASSISSRPPASVTPIGDQRETTGTLDERFRRAQFTFIAEGHARDKSAAVQASALQVQAPVYVSLYALGYRDLTVRRLISGIDGHADLIARIRVDHGQHNVDVFRFWFIYQALVSLLAHAPVTTPTQRVRAIIDQHLARPSRSVGYCRRYPKVVWSNRRRITAKTAPLKGPRTRSLGNPH